VRPDVRTQVAIGGAAGALARLAVVLVATVVHPGGGEVVAVLAVNLGGAFALGWLVGCAQHDERVARLVPLLGTGVLGASTTFSALAAQVALALAAGEVLGAVALAVLSLAGGVALAFAGVRVGTRAGEVGS
jgi:fluoride exporter